MVFQTKRGVFAAVSFKRNKLCREVSEYRRFLYNLVALDFVCVLLYAYQRVGDYVQMRLRVNPSRYGKTGELELRLLLLSRDGIAV